MPARTNRVISFTDFDRKFLIGLGDRVRDLEKKVKELEGINTRLRTNLRDLVDEGPL
jgi:hypothetical protein